MGSAIAGRRRHAFQGAPHLTSSFLTTTTRSPLRCIESGESFCALHALAFHSQPHSTHTGLALASRGRQDRRTTRAQTRSHQVKRVLLDASGVHVKPWNDVLSIFVHLNIIAIAPFRAVVAKFEVRPDPHGSSLAHI